MSWQWELNKGLPLHLTSRLYKLDLFDADTAAKVVILTHLTHFERLIDATDGCGKFAARMEAAAGLPSALLCGGTRPSMTGSLLASGEIGDLVGAQKQSILTFFGFAVYFTIVIFSPKNSQFRLFKVFIYTPPSLFFRKKTV